MRYQKGLLIVNMTFIQVLKENSNHDSYFSVRIFSNKIPKKENVKCPDFLLVKKDLCRACFLHQGWFHISSICLLDQVWSHYLIFREIQRIHFRSHRRRHYSHQLLPWTRTSLPIKNVNRAPLSFFWLKTLIQRAEAGFFPTSNWSTMCDWWDLVFLTCILGEIGDTFLCYLGQHMSSQNVT